MNSVPGLWSNRYIRNSIIFLFSCFEQGGSKKSEKYRASRFFKLLYQNIRSQGIQDTIWQEVTGSAQPGLNAAFIKRTWLAFPPIPAQTAIVRFLDWAERRIRRVIQVRQRRIKLLEEYRQVLISQAVTGRIDVRTGKPYPAYKESGMEWLGEVPEHWEVRRLKYLCRLVYGDALPAASRQDGSVPVYGSNGCLGFHSVSNTQVSCIVVGCKGSFGKVRYSDVPVFAIDTTFFVDDRFSSADLRWLFFVLGWLRLDEVSKDPAVPGLDSEDAYKRLLAIPPLPEQMAIAEFLDTQTAKLNAAIAADRRTIELLQEYRTRLIADLVTGKVDVREVAAQLPEEPPEEEAESMDADQIADGETTDEESGAEALSEEVTP